jgi:hypothetical protein
VHSAIEQQPPLQRCENNDCATPTMSEVSEQSNKFNADCPCEYNHVLPIPTTQLVRGLDDSILDDTHAETRHVHCIAYEKDELKLLSSLNTLGYIEFDILCDLNSLEEKFFAYSELKCLAHHTYHFIGKYNSQGEYLVHRIYICSDMKSPFGLYDHDKIGGCTNANNILQSPSSFSLKQQGQHKEGEHCSIQVASCSSIEASTFRCHQSKSRTTCSQEGENDEDITNSNMTMLMSCEQKVNQSYIMVIVATFDELMLHNDVCLLSFSEIHTWIKKNVKHSWKVWRIKEVDWGSSPSVPHVLHQATTSLMARRWKEIRGNTFWALDSDCRKAPSCDGRHGRIRSRIGEFKYFLEP